MSDKALQGFRYVEVQAFDTLQKIAARELGDATRWVDIVNINNLVYPYLTGDPAAAGPRVVLYGGVVAIPATSAQIVSADTNPEMVFGVDLDLTGGVLSASDGDVALVSGRPNLKQAYRHRIDTPIGDLLFHANYGCGVWRLYGRRGSPQVNALAAQYVRDAMLDDERTSAVLRTDATILGDRLSVVANVQPVTGAPVDLAIGS